MFRSTDCHKNLTVFYWREGDVIPVAVLSMSISAVDLSKHSTVDVYATVLVVESNSIQYLYSIYYNTFFQYLLQYFSRADNPYVVSNLSKHFLLFAVIAAELFQY